MKPRIPKTRSGAGRGEASAAAAPPPLLTCQLVGLQPALRVDAAQHKVVGEAAGRRAGPGAAAPAHPAGGSGGDSLRQRGSARRRGRARGTVTARRPPSPAVPRRPRRAGGRAAGPAVGRRAAPLSAEWGGEGGAALPARPRGAFKPWEAAEAASPAPLRSPAGAWTGTSPALTGVLGVRGAGVPRAALRLCEVLPQ